MSPMGPLSLCHDDENSTPAYTINPLDPEEFRRQGRLIIDFLADYYQNIERYPVLSQVEPGYLRKRIPNSAPDSPEPVETVLHDVQMDIIPGLTHWQSPNFFGYFPSNASTAGILGELLCSGFNVVGFNWISSPAATELESIVMDWLGGLLNLPESFLFSGTGGGVLHGSTCEAVLCTLVAARDRKLKETGRENIGKLVVYGSDQTHPTLKKAAQIAGIHPANFRAIPTTKSAGFRLSPDALRSEIELDLESGLIPAYLCATVGATASGAIDPLGQLSEAAQRYGVWVHVDAAYAGSACICPEFRHFIDGVETVNSFSFNPHKWLLTGLDCCCLWVNDTTALVRSLSTESEILRNKASDSKQVVDYKDWQIALSRRFRAMKMWMVLRTHGARNLRRFLRGHVKMARHFEALVRRDKRFEVVTPTSFSLVCFRVVPGAMGGCDEGSDSRANELNRRLVESVNASGQAFVTHAVLGGVYVVRLAVGATLADFRHVDMAWKLLQQHATALIRIVN